MMMMVMVMVMIMMVMVMMMMMIIDDWQLTIVIAIVTMIDGIGIEYENMKTCLNM